MPSEELGYEDLYVGCERSGLFSLGGDEFSVSLIRTTLADPFLARFGIVQDELRARRLCDFSKIPEIMRFPGPKFVFAAFTVPHQPFLFGRNGEPVRSIETSYTAWGSREQYIDQLHYVNQRVEEILDTLLSTPGYSPAVIIQGDHGTWFLHDSDGEDVYRELLQILNAYLLPGGGRELLYDGITPVNSFRIIFNHYFGANYELLEDNSYYTDMDKGWYNYLDVTDAVRGAQQ